MNYYESVLIFNENCTTNEVEKVIDLIRNHIENNGKVESFEDKGLKTLAYEIKKCKKGHYYVIMFLLDPTTLNDLERIYRIKDEIIKFITIKLDKKEIE